jgi:subtilisin-like proprotein convertase family protein
LFIGVFAQAKSEVGISATWGFHHRNLVRRLPDDLPGAMREKISDVEQTSSASARVTCRAADLEPLMTEARKFAPTHHAYETEDVGDAFLITDRIMVSFEEALSVEEVGAFAGKYALETVRKLSDKDYLFRLTDDTGMNPVKLVVKLTEKEDLVANVDHDLNMVFRKSAVAMPTDSAFARQWHLHRRRPASSDYDSRSSARCETAWQLLDGFGSSDVVVGVTDDGCQLDHPDFDSTGKFAGWAYFPDQSSRFFREGDPGADPDKMYVSGQDHGTACAGVIAAENDGQRTVGAAPGCRLLPVRWHSDGPSLFISDSKLQTVLNYVDDKIDVLSNSWGGAPHSNWGLVTLNQIDRLARSGGRRRNGIVFLWAAGNENCPISHRSTVDIPHTSGWGRFGWVGVDTSKNFSNNLVGRPGVMHVAALASTAQRSHYSNYGTGIGLCAPSSNSHAYWRLTLPGLGITTTEGGDRVTDTFGGTSSATPLVGGIAALVISANPALTGFEVIALLKRTCSKDLNMTAWPKTPGASFDPNPTWDVSPVSPFDSGAFTDQGFPEGTWSPWFGHGKIDAAIAVNEALDTADQGTVRVNGSRTANLDIPDRDPTGVVSRLVINDSGQIRSFKVSVDISHTWIGDLKVRLTGPDGQRVDLHSRGGGNKDNIIKTYDGASTPDLSIFLGTDVRGVWVLEVTDHAHRDLGSLNHWGIEAEVLTAGEVRIQSSPSATIPDDDPNGISDTIRVSDTRSISDIAVELDISHSWIGDLV